MADTILGEGQVSLFVAGTVLGEAQVSLFVAGAILGEGRCWVVILHGRCSIWSVWRVTFVAPRTVNDVSYVTGIRHGCLFSWQSQYLVKVMCHSLGEGQVSLTLAGAVLGEGHASIFVAGAAFGEIWKHGRSAKCCFFRYKMLVLGAKSLQRVADWRVHGRIMLGSCFGCFPQISARCWMVILRGRRSLVCLTLLLPINWLYYQAMITTKRSFKLRLLLLSDSITWLYYYSAILLLYSTITERFCYLTPVLLSDSITSLYYY